MVRAGLWEKEVQLLSDIIDFKAVLRIAEEQSVTGLVTAGVEKISTGVIPLPEKLTLLGKCHLVEKRNMAMNIATLSLVKKLQEANINVLLVKGQGIAQCYTRPLWRSSSDIDFFFSKEDFHKAVELLTPLATEKVQDAKYTKSYGLMIDGWFVELHGTLRNSLSSRMDKVIDEVQEDTFRNGNIRVWHSGGKDILMPNADNDLFLLFTHFVRHFYKGGFTIRQLCDWCRLLWTYKDSLNLKLLKTRLKKAGLMDEWRAFAALAVDWLGMLPEAMPMYDDNIRWHKKGEKMIEYILNGTHGKMRDTLSIAIIFPWNTIRFLPAILFNLNWLKAKEGILKR